MRTVCIALALFVLLLGAGDRAARALVAQSARQEGMSPDGMVAAPSSYDDETALRASYGDPVIGIPGALAGLMRLHDAKTGTWYGAADPDGDGTVRGPRRIRNRDR